MKIFLLLGLLGILGFTGNSARSGERADLLPPQVRWWAYPEDVTRVVVDRTGRPWCELKGNASVAEVKAQVEASAKWRAPWVRGARILLFDRQDRIWLLPGANGDVLLGFDLRTGRWLERAGVPPEERGGYDDRDPNVTRYTLTGPAFESRAGRLYFGDRTGVHVLDGERWSYQHLYRANIAENLYFGEIRSFNEPAFAEDEHGTVYAWSTWGRFGWSGTVGYFRHDGRVWEQVRRTGVAQDRIRSVVPLADGRLLICPENGASRLAGSRDDEQEFLHSIRQDILLLGHAEFAMRQEVQLRLKRRGPEILPEIRRVLPEVDDPEVAMRLQELVDGLAPPSVPGPWIDRHAISNAHVCGRDAGGNILIWADRIVPADGAGEFRGKFAQITPAGGVAPAPSGLPDWFPGSVHVDRKGRYWLARHDKGCVLVRDGESLPVTDETETSFRFILGEDGEGRVFLTDERSVVAIHPDFPESRAGLPSTIHDVPRGENVVCQDADGRIWAQLSGPSGGFLSRWQDGAWRHVDPPDGKAWNDDITFMQPLRGGGLVVQQKPDSTAVLFDGETWRHYPNLRELAQSQYQTLKGMINNRAPGRDFYTKLRVDARGNVWLIEWDKCGVFDGSAWAELVRWPDRGAVDGNIDFCWPMKAGGSMLVLDDSRHLVSFDRGFAAEPFGLNWKIAGSDYTTRSGLWLDSRRRLWLPGSGSRSAVVEHDRLVEVPDSGFPRFEDSSGAVWFLNPDRKRLVVLDPSGQRAEIPEPALHETTAIVEDRPGSFWVGTRRGLLHLIRSDRAGVPAFLRQAHYEHRVPKGTCLQMFADRERNLWFYGPGPQDYRLYRVELPAPDEPSPARP